MLRNYEVPDNFYPMGELESIESLQLELNETRNQMLNHRKRFARKWIYARDVFDEDGVRALESDVDNTMIPIMGDGNPANYIAPLPSIGTPPDFYNQSAMIEEDINTVTGVSDYMRGQPERQHPSHRHRGGDDPGRRQLPGPRQAGQGRVVPRRRRRTRSCC